MNKIKNEQEWKEQQPCSENLTSEVPNFLWAALMIVYDKIVGVQNLLKIDPALRELFRTLPCWSLLNLQKLR